MLRRQDVGHRVVVRRIVGVSQDRPLFTDALGELVDITETHLTIATNGTTLRVPLREVHRAKRVPAARRPRAADVAALEAAANEAWRAPIEDRLGDWLLRSAQGWTGRANSALAVGDPDRPLEAAIDAIQSWYAGHGRRAMINAPMPLAAPVNAALDARGWDTLPVTLVQTAPLTLLLPPSLPPPSLLPPSLRPPSLPPPSLLPHGAGSLVSARSEELPPVRLTEVPSDDWLAMVAQHKGALPDVAVRLLTAAPVVTFAEVRDADGGLLAVARGTVSGPERWHGVTLVQVAPAARRRGLARHVMGALAQWAAQAGSTRAFLQVEERNTAATALYDRLGFHTHHTYLTRREPSSTEDPGSC